MFQTANGIGRAASTCMDALFAEGLRPRAVDLSGLFNQVDMQSAFELHQMPRTRSGTLILFANAPETERALMGLGLRRWHQWRIIGAWAWELPVAPPHWRSQTDYVSEIWAPSRFVRDAFADAYPVPVRSVPHFVQSVDYSETLSSSHDRGNVSLRVLISADGRSSLHRKNLLAAISIFQTAFEHDNTARLVVKCRNLSLYPQYQSEIQEIAKRDSRIEVIDRNLNHVDQHKLLEKCDIVLSAHRAEGFGLHLAEAMAAGKVVVATGWSGNLEFMTPQNSVLLPFKLTPVSDPTGIYGADQNASWAEVDRDSAVKALRQLAGSASRREALGVRARLDIGTKLSSAAYVEALRTTPHLDRSVPSDQVFEANA